MPGSAQSIAKPKKKSRTEERERERQCGGLREADSAEANGLTLIMYFFYLTLVMDSTLLSNEFSIGRKRIQRVGRTNSEKC